jgi:hypothetical protein
MTDWQDRDNGDAVLDGWYAILVSWGTPWEEDTPDVLLFRDGAWVQRQKDCSLPNFYYFQGPFQSSMEARNWGHAHDGVGKYFAERAEEALRARAALAQPEPTGLPPGYNDPEHTGADRRLLQVFYRACQSEGGIRAVVADALLTQPEPQGPTDLLDETLLNEADAYFLYGEGKYTASLEEVVAFARRMFLAGQSWGRPAIEPVPGVEGADA